MNDYKLRKIIKETIISVLAEADSPDLVPQDGILRNPFMNQWRMYYHWSRRLQKKWMIYVSPLFFIIKLD